LKSFTYILPIILLAVAVSTPSVTAQTTEITNVTYVPSALYNIDTGTTDPPLILNATVNYSDGKSGYFLATGVFDLDDGNLVYGLGSSAPQSCAVTARYAGCIVPLTTTAGSENVQFMLSRPKSVWNLALIAALLDSGQNPIANSFSDYTFTINVHSALTLNIKAPVGVTVTVDGTKGSGGSVQLVLAAGNHDVSVPEIVQVDNATRMKFSQWSDGLTSANRTVALNYDVTLQANYVTQYRLRVISPVNVTGATWYDSGAKVQLMARSATMPMNGILGIIGAKWNLQAWLEDGVQVSNSTRALVTMNSPHVVSIVWRANYNVPLSVSVILAVAIGASLSYTKRQPRRRKHSRHRKTSSHGKRRRRN
jgi:hypothetical protein